MSLIAESLFAAILHLLLNGIGSFIAERPPTESDFFGIASRIATPLALAGITLAALFYIFKTIIDGITHHSIRPAPLRTINRMISLMFVLALVFGVLGFCGFIYVALNKEVTYSGEVMTPDSHGIPNARVEIDSFQTRTDSEGKFTFTLKESKKTAHFRVTAPSYETLDGVLAPQQMPPIVLQESPNQRNEIASNPSTSEISRALESGRICDDPYNTERGVSCPWWDFYFVPKLAKSEIEVSITLTVDITADCPDPHRRGNIILSCGEQSADSGALGQNNTEYTKQVYYVKTYCKTSMQPVHIIVTARPRGCSKMTSTGADGDVMKIREIKQCS
jgi:hypothetical protein